MIGIVVVTHGGLAQEFRAALEHVMGRQDFFETISIGPDDDLTQRRAELVAAAARAKADKGVIVMTDMFGGTPSNLAISIMEETGAEVIAGINLPMLIKLATVRKDMPLDKAILAARDAGRKYISVASQILSGEPGA
jgi:mannose PTS system EIIA component